MPKDTFYYKKRVEWLNSLFCALQAFKGTDLIVGILPYWNDVKELNPYIGWFLHILSSIRLNVANFLKLCSVVPSMEKPIFFSIYSYLFILSFCGSWFFIYILISFLLHLGILFDHDLQTLSVIVNRIHPNCYSL